jgi:hypothetical protein
MAGFARAWAGCVSRLDDALGRFDESEDVALERDQLSFELRPSRPFASALMLRGRWGRSASSYRRAAVRAAEAILRGRRRDRQRRLRAPPRR